MNNKVKLTEFKSERLVDEYNGGSRNVTNLLFES